MTLLITFVLLAAFALAMGHRSNKASPVISEPGLRGTGKVHHLDGSVTEFEVSGYMSSAMQKALSRKIFGMRGFFPRMWGAITHPTAVRNGIADYVVDLIDAGAGAGTLELQTSGDVEVATLTFSDPAFGAAASGTATASAITDDSSATGGTVAKFIIQDSDSTLVLSGSVTASGGGGDIEVTSVVIGATETVEMTSLTYTAPN